MYAIIATGGKQYKVSEGDIITIEKLGKEAGEKVTFDQVLAVSDNGIKVGSDVANASVEASVVKEGRGKKVIVYLCADKSVIFRTVCNAFVFVKYACSYAVLFKTCRKNITYIRSVINSAYFVLYNIFRYCQSRDTVQNAVIIIICGCII